MTVTQSDHELAVTYGLTLVTDDPPARVDLDLVDDWETGITAAVAAQALAATFNVTFIRLPDSSPCHPVYRFQGRRSALLSLLRSHDEDLSREGPA